MSTPLCDLSCQTKIILDGDSVSAQLIGVAGQIGAACEAVKHAFDNGAKFSNGNEIIETLNSMEDAADDLQLKARKVQKLVLHGVGYAGPLPKALK